MGLMILVFVWRDEEKRRECDVSPELVSKSHSIRKRCSTDHIRDVNTTVEATAETETPHIMINDA